MSERQISSNLPTSSIISTTKGCNKRKYFILRMKNIYYASIVILVIIVILLPLAIADWDPYEVIGVKRDASLGEIKKAYRELARKLHPDKSNFSEEDASKRFIELNKAFNILKDPDRRSRYDQHGDIEESRHSRGYYQQPHQNRQTREYWSNVHGYKRTFTFKYSNQQDSYLRKKSISSRQYYTEYLKKSKIKPFFIFFFSDFCPTCNIIEGTWSKIADELAKYNIDSFSINVHHEPRLSQDIGIHSIPHIACLIDGEIKPYYQSEISLANIVKFTRNLLPNNLVQLLISEEEQDRYIALGPQQNKLSAIILHNESNLKLRYLLLAFEFKSYYRFAHVTKKLSDFKTLAKKYNLSTELKSTETNLLVFDEDMNKPVINLSIKSGTFDMLQIRNQLYKWPFLKLPKLSSQQKFDDLCLYTIPKDGLKTNVRLCVILFSTDKPYSLPMRNKLIEFIEMNNLIHDDKVSFAYIDPYKQGDFVSSLLLDSEGTYPFKANHEESIESAIIILERHQQNNRKALHKWITSRWNTKNLNELDRAKLELYDIIMGYKRNHFALKDKIALDLLLDEDGPGLADRVFWRFVDHIFKMIFYITSRESFSTVLILIACALITSLLLYQSPNSPTNLNESSYNPSNGHSNGKLPESNNIHSDCQQKQQYTNNITQTLSKSIGDDFKIIELKAETYNGMIRLLKPGFRSIIVLVDNETKDKLLIEFRKAVWPYRRNKTLLFGYLCLDKNLQWYKCLLQEVLGLDEINVNKKNCIGTVLSLNGFKKYFRVYHAKHHEIDYYDDETDNDGSFLGFNDDDDDDDYDFEKGLHKTDIDKLKSNETVYTVDNLLDRLPIWLDKMFDGLTKRYFLDNWPDEMN